MNESTQTEEREHTEPRVTEIGAPEIVDGGTHPVATIVGVVLLVIVAGLAVLGLGGLIDDGDARVVPEVVVPRLANRTMAEAQAELERLGLIVDVRFEPNELVPPDVVVDQEPIAGARLEVGEQVVIAVSDGPMGVAVPDLSGAQFPEAQRTLSFLGLGIDRRDLHDEEVPMGAIIRSDPSAGHRAPLGSTVTVAVSLGPAPRTVPDVVGELSHAAMVELGRADLQIGGITTRRVDLDQVGRVLSTDPPAGAEVPRDQPIRVVVGSVTGSAVVPDVVGFREESARAAIAGANLSARVRAEPVPAGDPREGRVIRQSPVAGSPARRDDPTTVYVGVVPGA